MSLMHWSPRLVPIAGLLALGLSSPAVLAQPVPPMASPPVAASPLPAEPLWAVNLDPITARVAPTEDSDPVANLRKFTYLEVRGYQGEWAQVFNPRTR
jgi:hypothetical protein